MPSWLKRTLARGDRDPGAARWVVIEVETSGLDPLTDCLISIGGVAMHATGHVLPGDSLEVTYLQPKASSRDNILVHGIGVAAQLEGRNPGQATRAFLDFAGSGPILAFHAAFDRGFLARAVKVFVNEPFHNPWLDLAALAPALDDWLVRYGIPVSARHSAAGDAFATALLAARLLHEARRQGANDFAAMQRLARAARWVQ